MRAVLYVITGLAVMALAFWAYRENYLTQEALRQTDHLRSEIGRTREALRLQQAEWAYLNRPERLRDLAELNFPDLELMPLSPEHFGDVDQIAYPAPILPPITDPIDVSGALTAPSPEGQP
ncbi:MAG: cell division protein FtsL [Brevirhabdus sp.]